MLRLVTGESNREIAAALVLSVRTVEKRVAAVSARSRPGAGPTRRSTPSGEASSRSRRPGPAPTDACTQSHPVPRAARKIRVRTDVPAGPTAQTGPGRGCWRTRGAPSPRPRRPPGPHPVRQHRASTPGGGSHAHDGHPRRNRTSGTGRTRRGEARAGRGRGDRRRWPPAPGRPRPWWRSPSGAAGAITEYPLAEGSRPFGITVGPDGALWFHPPSAAGARRAPATRSGA